MIIDRMEEGTDNGEQPGNIIRAVSDSSPTVSITYFVQDAIKDGGSYVTVTRQVRKIDLYQRLLFLADNSGSLEHLYGMAVNINDVVKIDGEIFAES